MRRRGFLIFGVIIHLTVVNVMGQKPSFFEIKKTNYKLIFDGVCDEALWQNADSIPMFMFRPNHGGRTDQRSEVFITFDDKNLYVGARLHYSGDARPIVTTKKRDGIDGGSDNFGIMLDTFNDNENALCFETNPAAVRSDFTISNDGQTNEGRLPFNRSWNTFWDVKTSLSDNLWQLEMRIPVSSLRFQAVDGKVYMGMSIWRLIVSLQETQVFPLMTNEFGRFSIWKPSQAMKVVFNGLQMKKPVYLTPYVLAGMDQENQYDASRLDYKMKTDFKWNAGLDLKYSLTSNMTLDVTLNTDFAQVEVDDQLVNLTRFSLFYPEKRQFFIERSSIFTMRTGYMDQLFYSRRIGIYENEIVPIIAGARLVGRVGNWDLGFMDMQTAAIDFVEDTDSVTRAPSTNYGVLRVRKGVFNSTYELPRRHGDE